MHFCSYFVRAVQNIMCAATTTTAAAAAAAATTTAANDHDRIVIQKYARSVFHLAFALHAV